MPSLNLYESGAKMNANVIDRALLISRMVEQYYEPGNQSRCRLWIFRNYIKPVYPMSERTFWRYMGIAKEKLFMPSDDVLR